MTKISTQALQRAQNVTADTNMSVLITLAADLQNEQAVYTRWYGVPNPDFAQALQDLDTAASNTLRAEKIRRMRELEAQIESLKTATERRQEATDELAALQAALGVATPTTNPTPAS